VSIGRILSGLYVKTTLWFFFFFRPFNFTFSDFSTLRWSVFLAPLQAWCVFPFQCDVPVFNVSSRVTPKLLASNFSPFIQNRTIQPRKPVFSFSLVALQFGPCFFSRPSPALLSSTCPILATRLLVPFQQSFFCSVQSVFALFLYYFLCGKALCRPLNVTRRGALF